MYQSERMNEILKILNQYHYVTVDYLVEKIRYSPASIRRDLTLLEKQGLVKRSYGGVELLDEGSAPFRFRQHSMKLAKNSIAKAAADLVRDHDTIFVDGSSSAQYLGHFLSEKKGLTAITNNMLLASDLQRNGITAYCTGGYISEIPGILAGDITSHTFSVFHADIMFFSTGGYANGMIYENNADYYHHHRIMLENSERHVFLCGSDKIGKKLNRIVCTLNEIDYFISDTSFSNEMKEQYPDTRFISVKNS